MPFPARGKPVLISRIPFSTVEMPVSVPEMPFDTVPKDTAKICNAHFRRWDGPTGSGAASNRVKSAT